MTRTRGAEHCAVSTDGGIPQFAISNHDALPVAEKGIGGLREDGGTNLWGEEFRVAANKFLRVSNVYNPSSATRFAWTSSLREVGT